jgi:hypothetical protein
VVRKESILKMKEMQKYVFINNNKINM